MSQTERHETSLNAAHRQHARHWRDHATCYPVVSRRSAGLSIGINLNPDKACNFGCIYCQVDRAAPPTHREVDLTVLKTELAHLLDMALDGSLFTEPPFDCFKQDRRRIRDIAFSGDGEPTLYPRFDEAVRIAADAKRARGLDDTKLVLLSNACYLTQPKVRAALRVFDENNGEVWAKLDAGTQAYYESINRSSFPLSHVVENILDAARRRPIVIQSLWMQVRGKPPPEAEVRAYADKLNEILAAGGRIKLIQVYTIARSTTEPYVAALSHGQLDHVAATIRKLVHVQMETYHGIDDQREP